MDGNTVLGFWDIFHNHIPSKLREDVAMTFIDYVYNMDVDIDSLLGYDPYLDDAITAILGEEGSDNNNFDDEDDYAYDEDQD